MTIKLLLSLVLALAAAPLAAGAQEGAAACPIQDATLPAELAAWTSAAPITAAATASSLAKAQLRPGRAVSAALNPSDRLSYVAAPGKLPLGPSYGGLFRLDISRPGTYAVALGVGAWIDVVKTGDPIASTGHGHGPTCSTVRKIVDFPLSPGAYVVQIAGSPATSTKLLVLKRP